MSTEEKPKTKKAKSGPTAQKDPPEQLTGDYESYRLRGYTWAKPLPVEEEGDKETYSVFDGENYTVWDADDFREKYINVPPAKRDNSEAYNF